MSSDHRARPDAGTTLVPSTSGTAQALVILAVLALLAARMPDTVRELVRTAPAQLREEVGDPALLNLAVAIGASLGLAVTVLSLAVFLGIAKALERHVDSARLGNGRVRVGVLTATVAACFLVAQAKMVLPVPGSVPPQLAAALAALVTGLLIGVLFLWLGARSGVAGRVGLTLAATAGLAFATSVTGLPS